MQKFRGKLTYANVVSSICLFLLLGGATAVAAGIGRNSVGTKQLKNEAVTLAKIAQGTRTSLKGQTGAGATGAQGPKGDKGEPGAPGSAVAFVEILGGDASISGEHAKNITQANISKGTSNGIFCFKNLPFKWDVVSAIREGGGNDAGLVNYTRGIGLGCPAGTQLTITSQVFSGGAFSASGNRVMVVFY